MSIEPDAALADIRGAVESAADPGRAPAMAAYMKHRFVFLGVAKPARDAATREIIRGLLFSDPGELSGLVSRLWALPAREYQYVALDVLARHGGVLGEDALAFVRGLVTTNSWWDSVDGLALVVGAGTLRFAAWADAMRAWSVDENLWVRRTAIIHQLGLRDGTDFDRLCEIVLANAADREFFIRKAIGWALRNLAWSRPDEVEAFVVSHREVLSPLSQREALKNLAKAKAKIRGRLEAG